MRMVARMGVWCNWIAFWPSKPGIRVQILIRPPLFLRSLYTLVGAVFHRPLK